LQPFSGWFESLSVNYERAHSPIGSYAQKNHEAYTCSADISTALGSPNHLRDWSTCFLCSVIPLHYGQLCYRTESQIGRCAHCVNFGLSSALRETKSNCLCKCAERQDSSFIVYKRVSNIRVRFLSIENNRDLWKSDSFSRYSFRSSSRTGVLHYSGSILSNRRTARSSLFSPHIRSVARKSNLRRNNRERVTFIAFGEQPLGESLVPTAVQVARISALSEGNQVSRGCD
jgi:hypothetical protein